MTQRQDPLEDGGSPLEAKGYEKRSSRNWETQRNGSLEPPEGVRPCCSWVSAQRNSFQSFDLLNCKRINVCCLPRFVTAAAIGN